MILTAKAVAWFNGRPAERLVVSSIGGFFAPSVLGANAAYRQESPGSEQAIGPPPQPHRMKPATRRAAVTFALIGPDSGAAERYRHGQRAGEQPSLRSAAGFGGHVNGVERNP